MSRELEYYRNNYNDEYRTGNKEYDVGSWVHCLPIMVEFGEYGKCEYDPIEEREPKIGEWFLVGVPGEIIATKCVDVVDVEKIVVVRRIP